MEYKDGSTAQLCCQNFIVGAISKKKSEKILSIGEEEAIMNKMFAKHCPNTFGECKLKSKNKSRKQEGTFRKWKPWALGSYLRHRPEGRSSGNLESRFTESPTSPGQQHLQGPQWPQPGPYSWPCCCSAATPSALWAASCLSPPAWPTGGS